MYIKVAELSLLERALMTLPEGEEFLKLTLAEQNAIVYGDNAISDLYKQRAQHNTKQRMYARLKKRK